MQIFIPYARQSRSNEASVSIEDQLADITRWAERAGDVTLAEPVIEKNVSGKKPWRERELGTVVEELEAGRADGIVVAYFSRLTREKLSQTFDLLETLEPYHRADAKRGRVAEPGEGIDWTDVIDAKNSHDQWTDLKGHLDRGKHRSWQAGIFVGGAVPAGYVARIGDRKNRAGKLLTEPLEVNRPHLDVIGRALTLRANGGSWSEVARLLRDGGVPTSRGNMVWSTNGAAALARNPIYRGLWRCTCGCGEEIVRPELSCVTKQIWERAQPTKTGKPGRTPGSGYSLLAGLLRCAGCGYAMSANFTTSTSGKRYRFYRCQGGDHCAAHASISADLIEPYMLAEALWRFHVVERTVGRKTDVGRIVELEAGVETAERRFEMWDASADPLDPGYAKKKDALRADIATAKAALAEENAAHVETIAPESVAELAASGTVDEQRRFLRMLLIDGTVRAGRMPVEERVFVEYRGIASERPEWAKVAVA